MTSPLPTRRVRLPWPEQVEPRWTPQTPEFAVAANAVSLLMPYAEPYVVASVRSVLDQVEDPVLAADARAYVAQEAQHHGQHRRYNDHLVAAYPGLARVEQWFDRIFSFLRRRSTGFGVAFAAGFETVAFVGARWVDKRQALMRDAEPTAATLFLWHLAEEVEHKTVAHDVYRAIGGGRFRYLVAMLTATVVLALGALAGCLTMLAADRKLFSPVSHLRLASWSLSFAFTALPVMAVSVLPSHHPRELADPAGLEHWLDHLDPATSTVPEWALP